MYYLTPLCCVCSESSKNLRNLNNKNNQQLKQKFQYCTYGIDDVDLDVPLYMCKICLHNLNVAYEFKKSCATNIARLRSYVTQLVQCKLSTDFDIKDKHTIPRDEKGFIVSSDIQVNITRCSPSNLSFKGFEPTTCVVKSIKTEVDPVLGESLNINDEHLLFDTNSAVDAKESIENLSCLSEIIKKEHDITINDSQNQPIKNEVLADEEIYLNHLVKEISLMPALSINDLPTSASLQSTEELDVRRSELENSSNKLLWNTKSEIITKSSDTKEEFLDVDSGVAAAANGGDSPCGRRTSQTKRQVPARLSARSKKVLKNKPDLMYKCNICERRFSRINYLRNHLRSHRPREQSAANGGDSPRDQRTPQAKRQASPRRSTRFQEASKRKLDSLYKCNTCKIEFYKIKDLQRHLQKHRTHDQSYRCTVCGKKCSGKQTLRLHIQIHSGNRKRYKCTLCPMQYYRNDDLKVHFTKTHQTKCNKCNKVFTSNKEFLLHRTKEHLKEFYFECEICGKVMTQRCKYRIHVRSHESGTPFQCTRCPEAFQNYYRLKRHMALEHNVGKLTCNNCGKSFSDKSVFDAHVKAHETQLPHVCAQCGKKFKREKDFRVHVKKHNLKNCYKCNRCGRIYIKSLMYKNHILTHSET